MPQSIVSIPVLTVVLQAKLSIWLSYFLSRCLLSLKKALKTLDQGFQRFFEA